MRFKRGVCQDFTHVFVAAARCAGIPARYISGYFCRTDKTEQNAGHAWAEAYIDDFGWLAFDPTHGICPIQIACPRRRRTRLPGRRPGARLALRRQRRVSRRSRSASNRRGASHRIKHESRQLAHCRGRAPHRYNSPRLWGIAVMTYCCGILVRDGLGDDRGHADQCRTRQHLGVSEAARIPEYRANASWRSRRRGNLSLTQTVISSVSEGHRESRNRRTRNTDERADDVSGRTADRPRHPHPAQHRRQGCWRLPT